MLPPSPMLTIKNGAGYGLVRRRPRVSFRRFSLFGFMVSLMLLSGCTPSGPRALLEGKRLMDQENYPQAIQKLKTASSLLGGTNALAWNYLGVAYQHTGAHAEAEWAYQRALALNHDLSEVRFNLGCLSLAQNKLEAAKTEFTVYTSLRPNAVEGFLKLGATQLRSREPGAAEKSFNEALRLSPRNPEAFNGLGLARLQRGRAPEAAQCFESALKQQPGYRPALLNLAIVAHQHLKDRQLALQKYREYLALKPPPPNAAALAAIVRQLEQELNPPSRPAATNTVAQPNLSTNPARPPATNATRMASAPKPEPVARLPKSDVTNPPKPAPAGTALTPAAPNVPKPAPSANVAVVKPPGRPTQIQSPAGLAQGEPAKSDANRAEPAAASAPASPPKGPPARYAYKSPPEPAAGNRSDAERSFAQAMQAYQAHRLPEAIQSYRLAAQQDPSLFEAHYNLGLVATEAGNLSLALMSYEDALAIQPTSLDARYNFALVLKQANYLSDAVNELEKVLASYPNETRAHLALANIYAQQLREPAKARQHYLKVLEVAPQHPQAGAIRYWLKDNPL
jgi:Flp pilus assembly protein TadD